jgi:hypothetical protein
MAVMRLWGAIMRSACESGRSRPAFRDDVAHCSEMMSPTPLALTAGGASAALLDPQGRFLWHCPKEVTNASREVCRTVIGSPAVRDFRKALSAVPTDIPTGKLRA